jgi:glycosyltransferase involved in cell wall biosynthesis
MNPKLKAWIIATKFPNTIQPWLANSTAQVVKHGGEVNVLSMEAGDAHYSAAVDEFKLDTSTINMRYHGAGILLAIANNFLNPLNVIKSVRGLLVAHRYLSPHKSKASNLIAALVLAPYLAKHKVDIIHSHFEITGHKFLPVVRAQAAPFVVTFHGLPPPGVAQLPAIMRAEYINAADVILVNTEFAKRQYLNLGAPADKIRIIPQGIVTRDFAFSAKPCPSDSAIELLTVGRFHKDKGHIYVLQALPALLEQGYNLRYTMVGAGPEREQLERVVDQLNLRAIVSFHTGLSEERLKAIYSAAHIFILPSLKAQDGFHEETQGVAIQEAQASGLIVIATKTGGIPECVDDGTSAFLVEDRNAAAIGEKIKWIIDNPHQWHEWQHNARSYVENHFDIDVIGIRLMQIYADTIAQFQRSHQG